MRALRSIVGVFLGLTILTAIASAISAAVLKRRLPSHGEETDDDIALVTIYTGRDFKSTATAFRGGSVLTWYGGGTIDLRAATLDPTGARLTARTVFGGLRLVVPETWSVEQRATAIAGGISDTRDQDHVPPGGPTIVLDGFALFGGIGIFSDAPDLDLATPLELAPEVSAPAPA
ncbi:MAG TPA: LiaF domain-containing protein [Candidatus Limnocylindrales bacterium]|nr:LiaF domain-containing protein [Candidatus Limnocylindrales bacterium]